LFCLCMLHERACDATSAEHSGAFILSVVKIRALDA
jgi:hypothetical protein